MNTELLFLLIILSWTINGIAKIILGAIGSEKDKNYGLGDVIIGLLDLGLVVWVYFG